MNTSQWRCKERRKLQAPFCSELQKGSYTRRAPVTTKPANKNVGAANTKARKIVQDLSSLSLLMCCFSLSSRRGRLNFHTPRCLSKNVLANKFCVREPRQGYFVIFSPRLLMYSSVTCYLVQKHYLTYVFDFATLYIYRNTVESWTKGLLPFPMKGEP